MTTKSLREKIEEILGSRRSWIDSQQSMVSKRDMADTYDRCTYLLLSLFSEMVEGIIGGPSVVSKYDQEYDAWIKIGKNELIAQQRQKLKEIVGGEK